MFVLHRSVVYGLLGGFFAILLAIVFSYQSALLSFTIGSLIAFVTILILALTYSKCQEKYYNDLQVKKLQRSKLEKELSFYLSKTCCKDDEIAAKYESWQGTVHTFSFENSAFAIAFEQANPGKCLRNGQIHH